MWKKVLSSVAISSILLAGNINLDLGNLFSNGKNWNISMSNNGTYYLMLPINVNFSTLQKAINTQNGTIWVYRWYQKAELVKADFGINVLGVVQITKDKITYWIQDNDNWVSKNNFEDFKTYLENRANDIVDNNKKNIFINSYIPSFNKIVANKLYLIMPKNMDLSFDLTMPNLNNSNVSGITSGEAGGFTGTNENNSQMNNQTNSNSTSEIGNLPTPPQPPNISN